MILNTAETHSTEWALLFPLKAGLFTLRTAPEISRSTAMPQQGRSAIELSSPPGDETSPKVIVGNGDPKSSRIRRRSSMSDLDKLSAALPDLVRSAAGSMHYGLSFNSLPHSPHAAKSICSSGTYPQGSIGDLMNLKKYGGSSWSVRSETLVAKTVPLSTVTPRHSPTRRPCCENMITVEILDDDEEDNVDCDAVLTSAQRTQKLTRLLKKQRASANRALVSLFLNRSFRGRWRLCIYGYCKLLLHHFDDIWFYLLSHNNIVI